jgi:hypothetical protein
VEAHVGFLNINASFGRGFKMLKRLLSLVASGLFLAVVLASGARADVLQTVKQKGVLTVGTKADYRPFGFLDPSGKIVGFEADLAADVAKRLGVKLELLPVVASNRIQFLQQGKIDMMIATMSDTPERRKIVDIVEPSYYGSGTNVLAPKSAKLTSWEGLRGKKICLIQGSFYNKELQEKYGNHRRNAEARLGRLRNAAGFDPVRAVGPRGQSRRKGLCRFHVEDDHRLAQDRHDPAAREKVGNQAHQVGAGDARQIQVTAGAAGAFRGAA